MDNAFLRCLPLAVERETYWRLTALMFSADAVEYNYRAIVQVTSKNRDRPERISHRDRVRLFTHVWSIVDQLHNCRKIFVSLDLKNKSAIKFIDEHEVATKIRNRMDHLNDNVRNLAKAKGPRKPIFGTLTYMAFPRRNVFEKKRVVTITGGIVAQVLGGPIYHQVKTQLLQGRRPGQLPVCMFRLEAFDHVLEIEQAVKQLGQIRRQLNKIFEETVERVIPNLAKTSGVSERELAKSASDRYVTCLPLKFKKPITFKRT